jgi:Mg2+/Co2+ transporter CorB
LSHFQVTMFSWFLLLLLALATFFSLAETALMAVNRYRLRHKARMKKQYAVQLLKLLQRPDRLLSVILIGNNFANILASSLATLIAFHYWGDNGALLAAIVLTFIVLIFAEVAPKTIAAMYPDKISRLVVYPVLFFLKLFYPIVWIVNNVTNALLRLFRIRVTNRGIEPLSREELRTIVYDTSGKISRQYQSMLLGILDLSDLTVDDVMIPRHEITGIDIEQPWEDIIKQLNQYPQDWIPIYSESINQLLGVFYSRDMLRVLLLQQPVNKEWLRQFLQEPYFVPEGTSLQIQLAHFQQGQEKVAFVVDEYGEIQGMLTLNDILEEIVGDFTSSVTLVKRINVQPDGSYLVDGAMTIREFNRTVGWDLPVGGPRTINGLIVEYLEALPHKGTAILVSGYPIEIVNVKENKVKLARVFQRLETPGM